MPGGKGQARSAFGEEIAYTFPQRRVGQRRLSTAGHDGETQGRRPPRSLLGSSRCIVRVRPSCAETALCSSCNVAYTLFCKGSYWIPGSYAHMDVCNAQLIYQAIET